MHEKIAEKWADNFMYEKPLFDCLHDENEEKKIIQSTIQSAINEAIAAQQLVVKTIEARQTASGKREIEHQKRIAELEASNDRLRGRIGKLLYDSATETQTRPAEQDGSTNKGE